MREVQIILKSILVKFRCKKIEDSLPRYLANLHLHSHIPLCIMKIHCIHLSSSFHQTKPHFNPRNRINSTWTKRYHQTPFYSHRSNMYVLNMIPMYVIVYVCAKRSFLDSFSFFLDNSYYCAYTTSQSMCVYVGGCKKIIS